MFKVKLFSSNAYYSSGMSKSIEDAFKELLQVNRMEEVQASLEQEPPFRDVESLQILAANNISFVENDWYSIVVDGIRTHIFELSRDIKFALCLIHYSRQGVYLGYPTDFPMVDNDECWEKCYAILLDMSFDILIGMPEMLWSHEYLAYLQVYLKGMDKTTVIENFPYGEERIEVQLMNDISFKNNDFYQPAELHDEYGPLHWLYQGKDGRYYMTTFIFDYALWYWWKNDLENVIAFCEGYSKPCELFDSDYVVKGIYEAEAEERAQAAKTRKYRYHYQQFKPDSMESTCRKLPIFCVVRYKDGSFLIHGDLTYKYPSLNEMIEQIDSLDEETEAEKFAIVIDAEELPYNVQDMRRTMYGFRVTGEALDIYNRDEAIEAFGKLLKEAYESGNYTVDKSFY